MEKENIYEINVGKLMGEYHNLHNEILIKESYLDGVKRRTRAGMGRCQAGFCSPRTMEIIERELGIPQEEITKSGGASRIVVGRTKE